MKFKLILPTLTMAVPALLPMVSCGPGRNDPAPSEVKLVGELGDGPYTSKIKAAKEESVDTEKANAEYFHDVANNLNIMADDFMSSEYGNVPGRRDVTYCSFECSVANTEQQLMNVAMRVKIDGPDGNNEQEYSIELKNFKFLLVFVNNEAVVTPDGKYVDGDNDGLCNVFLDGSSYTIDKNSKPVNKTLLKEQIFKYCRFKSHYFMDKKLTPAQSKFEVTSETSLHDGVTMFQLQNITSYSYCLHVAYEGTLTIRTDTTIRKPEQVLVHFKVNGTEVGDSWDGGRHMMIYDSTEDTMNIDYTILDQSFIPDSATIEITYTIQG